jgi:hypothetical protein
MGTITHRERDWLGSSPWLPGQIADDVDLCPEGQTLDQVLASQLDSRGVERLLPDVLDRFIRGPGRRQRACEDVRVGELPRHRNIDASDLDEPARLEELLAGTGPTDTMVAWFSTFSSAARRNGANAQAPGDTFTCPQTVNPSRPPGWRTL